MSVGVGNPNSRSTSPSSSSGPVTNSSNNNTTSANTSNIASSLPLPPQHYVSLYTDDNIKRQRIPQPPPPPPPRPPHDTYTMFGNMFSADDTIIRSLESQGFRRLYPIHFERRRELKKLNHSLVANFLDLLELLVQCPDSPRRAEKVDDLNLLFIHIHHLLNEFRPHQARETLRVMMELQKRQRIETALRFQYHLDRVQNILKDALKDLPDPDELDSKLTIPTEIMEHMDIDKKESSFSDPLYELDVMMCNIVDDMQ